MDKIYFRDGLHSCSLTVDGRYLAVSIGDGEFTDEEGEPYFLLVEYLADEEKWVVSVVWEDDNANVAFDNRFNDYITETEFQSIQKQLMTKPDLAYMFMTAEKAASALRMDRDLMLFDAMTGETDTLEMLYNANMDNYYHYAADCYAEYAIDELAEYKKLGTISEIRKAMETLLQIRNGLLGCMDTDLIQP